MAHSQKQSWPVWVGSEKVKYTLLINTLLVQVAQELVFILLSSEPRPSIPDCEATNLPLIQTQPTKRYATTGACQEMPAQQVSVWETVITRAQDKGFPVPGSQVPRIWSVLP